MHIGNSCKVFCRRATDIMQIACQMCSLLGLRQPKNAKNGVCHISFAGILTALQAGNYSNLFYSARRAIIVGVIEREGVS